ncbi:hypothetical protein NDU88_002168 [Pleurodeles waltl]|uniref:Secreted protein n=1 Tax=Pleurodeles waltl TaxID=8319 RepID=A0AAV7UUT3_PLEWA|nr:hypothetical protein NDU88_002168 [Pleurodeles waltl]
MECWPWLSQSHLTATSITVQLLPVAARPMAESTAHVRPEHTSTLATRPVCKLRPPRPQDQEWIRISPCGRAGNTCEWRPCA